MTATTFDTLIATQDLEAAGIERRQAEAIAKAIHHGDERAATKADLDTAVTGLRSELRAVASRVGALQWVVGIQSAITFATFATFAIVAAKLL